MSVARKELGDFADRVADYMATSITPWKDEAEMRVAVREAVRLVFEDAFFETWEIAKVQHLETGVGSCEQPSHFAAAEASDV